MSRADQVSRRLEDLRKDFRQVTDEPFTHFFCPILFRDEPAAVCYAHVVNEAFTDTDRAWTVQREDVDSFFGSMFESDFVVLDHRGRRGAIDVLADRVLSQKLRPQVTVDGEAVPHYLPGEVVPENHTGLLIERPGATALRLALKLTPTEALTRTAASWAVSFGKDLSLPAVVSLLKSAHLTMFELLGYRYALSAGGRYAGWDVLGSFFVANRHAKKADIEQAAKAHFQEFGALVRPAFGVPAGIRGTITDRFLYLCPNRNGAWAFLVLIRTGDQFHAVLLPVMEDVDNAARFVAFTRSPSPRIEAKLMRFNGKQWQVTMKSEEFDWPASEFA